MLARSALLANVSLPQRSASNEAGRKGRRGHERGGQGSYEPGPFREGRPGKPRTRKGFRTWTWTRGAQAGAKPGKPFGARPATPDRSFGAGMAGQLGPSGRDWRAGQALRSMDGRGGEALRRFNAQARGAPSGASVAGLVRAFGSTSVRLEGFFGIAIAALAGNRRRAGSAIFGWLGSGRRQGCSFGSNAKTASEHLAPFPVASQQTSRTTVQQKRGPVANGVRAPFASVCSTASTHLCGCNSRYFWTRQLYLAVFLICVARLKLV